MDNKYRAIRTQVAGKRLRTAMLALVERHGLHEHAEAMAKADAMQASVRDLYQLEAIAAFLDALVLTEGVTVPDATQENELATLSSVSPAVAERLAEAGITNVVTLRDATDEELRAIDGIGAATLRAIRAEVGEPTVPDAPAADAGAAAPPGGADAAEASEDRNATDDDASPPAEADAGEDGA